LRIDGLVLTSPLTKSPSADSLLVH
jgi:hypothetical protein